MAQQQRQHYGRQTDEYGNPIHQSEEHGNPLNSGGAQRTAGYGGEYGTTGGGYRGTQYGTTDIGGGTAGYGGADGTTGGGYAGTQYGTTDVEGGGGGGHKTAGYGGSHGTTDVGAGGGHKTGGGQSGTQHKSGDVGGGRRGAVIGGYSTSTTGGTGGQHHQVQVHYGTTGAGTGTGADLGLDGRPHQGDYGTTPGSGIGIMTGTDLGLDGRRAAGIGSGADLGHQESREMGGGQKRHDEQPVVSTTTIAHGVSYDQEGEHEENKSMMDKILDKVPGLH